MKKFLWNPKTWTSHYGKKWSVKILLRQRHFCCPDILWALICLFPRKEGQNHCTVALLSEGKVVPPTQYSRHSLTCHYFWLQELQHEQVLLWCYNFKAEKGYSDHIVSGKWAGSVHQGFCTQPQHTVATRAGTHTSSAAWKNKFWKHISNYSFFKQIDVC